MIVQRTLAGRHELIPEDYAHSIARIRGVQKVTPRLWGYYFHPASRANFTVMVADVYALADDQGDYRRRGAADLERGQGQPIVF